MHTEPIEKLKQRQQTFLVPESSVKSITLFRPVVSSPASRRTNSKGDFFIIFP